FVRPPQGGSPMNVDVESVLADYHQSLPGERKIASRSPSRQGSYDQPQGTSGHVRTPSQGQNLGSISREGRPGIGAHGRSSPHPISRSASPVAGIGNNPPRNPGGPGGNVYGQGAMRNVS